MIITKTPFRMSFFGGGTDMPNYFNKYGGAILSTTFDKYCYVTVRHLPRFFDYTTELMYAKTERVNAVDNIVHPLIRNAMQWLDMREIRLTYDADLPARSGLGSSSSFAVGMLHAFYKLKKLDVTKQKLADDAIYLERTLCKEVGGWQDQVAASFGGFNRVDFANNSYKVTTLNIDANKKQQLQNNLLMFFTGFTRFSADIQKQNEFTSFDKIQHLQKIYDLVEQAEQILCGNRDLDEFGSLLDETWKLKRQVGKAVSTDVIDELYAKAITAGALGGKLLGAGGGGFLVFYVPLNKQELVKNALKELLYIPFEFENSGTQIVYYAHEDYELVN